MVACKIFPSDEVPIWICGNFLCGIFSSNEENYELNFAQKLDLIFPQISLTSVNFKTIGPSISQ